MIALKEARPPPFRHFQAINIETAESFPNYLILNEHNRFYIAGRKFTHWLEINQPTIEKQLDCCTIKAAKQLTKRVNNNERFKTHKISNERATNPDQRD